MEAYQLAEGGYKDGSWFQRWISNTATSGLGVPVVESK